MNKYIVLGLCLLSSSVYADKIWMEGDCFYISGVGPLSPTPTAVICKQLDFEKIAIKNGGFLRLREEPPQNTTIQTIVEPGKYICHTYLKGVIGQYNIRLECGKIEAPDAWQIACMGPLEEGNSLEETINQQ